MEVLKQYWPGILILLYFSYKFYKGIQFKKLLPQLKTRGAQIIDVRSSQEYNSAQNPASINIPLNELKENANKIKKDVPIILCCASGSRASMGTRIIKSLGHSEVYNAGRWANTL